MISCSFELSTNKVVKLDLCENTSLFEYCLDPFVVGIFWSLCFKLHNSFYLSQKALRRIN